MAASVVSTARQASRLCILRIAVNAPLVGISEKRIFRGIFATRKCATRESRFLAFAARSRHLVTLRTLYGSSKRDEDQTCIIAAIKGQCVIKKMLSQRFDRSCGRRSVA